MVSAVARRLLTWANSVLAEGEPRQAAAEPVPPDAAYEPAAGGPPAHWVEKVRRGAPWLLENAPRPARRGPSAPALSLVEPSAPQRPPLEPGSRPWLPAPRARAAPPEPSAKPQARPPLRLAALPWPRPASKVQPPAPSATPVKANRSASHPPQPCGRFGISEAAEPTRETARPAPGPEAPDLPERTAHVPPTPESAPPPDGRQVLFLVPEGPGRAPPQPRPSSPSPGEEPRFLERPTRSEAASGQPSSRGNSGSPRVAPAAVPPRAPEAFRAPDLPARPQPSTPDARKMPAVPDELEAAAQVDPWPALPEAPEASPGPARAELREAERLRRLEREQRGA